MSSILTPTKLKEPIYMKLEIGENEIKLLEKVFEIIEKDPLAFDFLVKISFILLKWILI